MKLGYMLKNVGRQIDRRVMNPLLYLGSSCRRLETALSGKACVLYQRWKQPDRNIRDIPIVINNFNRLTAMQGLISWLEGVGMRRIIILDNGSSYPLLLDYYSRTRHEVVRESNLGPQALWASRRLWRSIRNDYYIYSDSDVVPDPDCPPDAIELLYRTLMEYPFLEKVGLGLRIDDLPDHYEKKADVIRWESKYWSRPVTAFLFDAPVDTTFAMYRPRAMGDWRLRAYRTGPPYVARHTPWYQNAKALSPEELYYAATAKRGVSTWLEARGTFAQSAQSE